MIKDIESRTGKPIDPLDVKIVRKPELDITKVVSLQNSPRTSGPAGPSARTNGYRHSIKGTSIEINFGNADKLSKDEVVKLVRTGTDLSHRDVGRITMGERYSHVEIVRRDASRVSMDLCRNTFRGKAVLARVI